VPPQRPGAVPQFSTIRGFGKPGWTTEWGQQKKINSPADKTPHAFRAALLRHRFLRRFATEHPDSSRLDGGTERNFQQIQGGPQIFSEANLLELFVSPAEGIRENGFDIPCAAFQA
jgi:hypothetical protein